jgi:hypothetical protein
MHAPRADVAEIARAVEQFSLPIVLARTTGDELVLPR